MEALQKGVRDQGVLGFPRRAVGWAHRRDSCRDLEQPGACAIKPVGRSAIAGYQQHDGGIQQPGGRVRASSCFQGTPAILGRGGHAHRSPSKGFHLPSAPGVGAILRLRRSSGCLHSSRVCRIERRPETEMLPWFAWHQIDLLRPTRCSVLYRCHPVSGRVPQRAPWPGPAWFGDSPDLIALVGDADRSPEAGEPRAEHRHGTRAAPRRVQDRSAIGPGSVASRTPGEHVGRIEGAVWKRPPRSWSGEPNPGTPTAVKGSGRCRGRRSMSFALKPVARCALKQRHRRPPATITRSAPSPRRYRCSRRTERRASVAMAQHVFLRALGRLLFAAEDEAEGAPAGSRDARASSSTQATPLPLSSAPSVHDGVVVARDDIARRG